MTHGVETTKSHTIRRVDMTPALVETLQRLYTRSREASIKGITLPELVFVMPSWA